MVTAIPMKFCKKKHYSYTNQGVVNTVNYITEQDMVDLHGLKFVGQWKVLARNLTPISFGEEVGYYYMDYQHYARATDSFLNPRS